MTEIILTIVIAVCLLANCIMGAVVLKALKKIERKEEKTMPGEYKEEPECKCEPNHRPDNETPFDPDEPKIYCHLTELSDTKEMMTSYNYKTRFAAEYWQLKIRCDKLSHLLVQHEAGTLKIDLDCPIDLLKSQLEVMKQYLHILEVRAEFEKIYFE